MAFDHADIQSRVTGLISHLGLANNRRAYLRRDGSDRDVIAIEARYSPRDIGTQIQANDKRFLIADSVDPPPDNEVDVLILTDPIEESMSEELIIVSPPTRVAPGGINYYWDLQCRQK